jgi:hypothetical protein
MVVLKCSFTAASVEKPILLILGKDVVRIAVQPALAGFR